MPPISIAGPIRQFNIVLPPRSRQRVMSSNAGEIGSFVLRNVERETLIEAVVEQIFDVARRSVSGVPPRATAFQFRDPMSCASSAVHVIPTVLLHAPLSNLSSFPRCLLAARTLQLPRGFRPDGDVEEWLQRWFPETDPDKGLSSLTSDLGLDLPRLATDLVWLGGACPAINDLIWSGRLGEALACMKRNLAVLTASDRKTVRQIVRDFAVVLSTIVAHIRMALLRQIGIAPIGPEITNRNTWQSRSAVFNECLIPAAHQLRAFVKDVALQLLSEPGAFLKRKLPGHHILENAEILAIAKEVEHRVFERSKLQPFRVNIDRDVKQFLVVNTDPLCNLTKQEIAEEASGSRSFVEAEIGFPATYGAVVVATSLLAAPARFKALMKGGAVLPKSSELKFPKALKNGERHDPLRGRTSFGAVKRATEFLRQTSQSDRSVLIRKDPDQDPKNRPDAFVTTALKKFEKEYPAQAVAVLMIDPACWFRLPSEDEVTH